jgi:hypothetical protein
MFFIRELGEAFCNDINKVATGELTGGGRSLSPPSELELQTSAKAQRATTSGGPLSVGSRSLDSRLIGFDFKSFTMDVPARLSFRNQVRRHA